MTRTQLSVTRLIDLAGGEDAIARALTPRGKKPTKSTHESLRHWPKRGIPERHWMLVADLACVDVKDVAEAVIR